MHLFVSTGEPSGDLHAGNLVRALREIDPTATSAGFGGEHLQAAGGELLFPLTKLSVMWFPHVLKSYRTFVGLIGKADDYFRDHRPDALVLIDYPGFNWHLARKAKERGIPVFYFVPPQLWAWGAWRVRKMKRWVDHIVCALPFEPEWYRARGISPQYFGHPYFDELARQRLNDSFLNEQRSRGKAIVAVLPGSRNQEVKANWPSFRQAIELIHARLPDARFLIAAYSESHRRQIADSLRSSDLPVETHVGRTKEIIALGDACMAVSGSVGLELLHGLLPSVVVYRTRWIDVPFLRVMMKVPYFSIVNLLAGEEVFPEFTAPRCPAAAIADRITGWLERPGELEHIRDRLRRIKEQVHRTGACKRAAEFILATHRVRQADAAGSVTEAQGKENVHILNRAILHQQQSAPVVTPLGADARE